MEASQETLRRKLERARAEIALLEGEIEERSRSLFLAQRDQREAAEYLGQVLATMDGAVLVVAVEGTVRSVNRAGCALLGRAEDEVLGRPWTEFLRLEGEATDTELLLRGHVEGELLLPGGEAVPVLFAGSGIEDASGRLASIVCVATDLTPIRRMEVELRHAQKLESIGQLAAGVAHEINTPVQFVGDSVAFLQDAFADLEAVLAAYGALVRAAEADGLLGEARTAVAAAEEDADLAFLREEMPAAFERAQDGVRRVARIVGAMKEFSHPGGTEKAPADLNAAIEATLTVSRNEYKYVAELETDLAELPPVVCNVGDLNQVVLNLVVNGAHAIEQKGATEGTGRILVRTERDGAHVRIEVRDSGSGMPPEVARRVFEPFFTTKEVGRGTGQGLSIAHSIVADKHGGTLTFETEPGVGTTFRIRIPIDGAPAAKEERDAA